MTATRSPSAAKRAGAGQADAAGPAGDEDDVRLTRLVGVAPPPQRSTALAAVMPAPKPTSSTRSPSSTRPASSASARASGIEADDVLPVWCSTVAARSIGMPRRSQAASMMRMLAWWGTTSVDVVGGDAGALHRLLGRVDHDPHGPAEDLLALHLDEAADLGVEEALAPSRRRRGPSRAAGPARRRPRARRRRSRRRTGWRCCGRSSR